MLRISLLFILRYRYVTVHYLSGWKKIFSITVSRDIHWSADLQTCDCGFCIYIAHNFLCGVYQKVKFSLWICGYWDFFLQILSKFFFYSLYSYMYCKTLAILRYLFSLEILSVKRLTFDENISTCSYCLYTFGITKALISGKGKYSYHFL